MGGSFSVLDNSSAGRENCFQLQCGSDGKVFVISCKVIYFPTFFPPSSTHFHLISKKLGQKRLRRMEIINRNDINRYKMQSSTKSESHCSR